MHVEFLVKDPTEIYACMIQVHKMASGIEGIVCWLPAGELARPRAAASCWPWSPSVSCISPAPRRSLGSPSAARVQLRRTPHRIPGLPERLVSYCGAPAYALLGTQSRASRVLGRLRHACGGTYPLIATPLCPESPPTANF